MNEASARIVRVAAALKIRLAGFCRRNSAVFTIYAVWKVLLFGVMVVANSVSDPSQNEWNRHFTRGVHTWAAPFANWDGQHYLMLSTSGYAAATNETVAFYPLFPLTTKLVKLFTTDVFFAAFATTTFFGLLFVLLLYATLRRLAISHEQSLWGVVLALSYPSAFFLTAFYSESIALFVIMGFFYFYAVKKEKWSLLFAALLPWTKGQGVFLVALLVLDMVVSIIRRQRRDILFAALNLTAIGLGAISLLGFYKYTTGNAFSHIDAQKYFVFNLSISNMFSPSHFLRSFYSPTHELFGYNNSLMDKIFIGFTFLCFSPVVFGKDRRVVVISLALMVPTAMMGEASSFIRHSLLIWPFIVLSILRQNLLNKRVFCIMAGLLLMVQLYFATRFAANLWVG
jgi:hypothetical protein